MSLLEIAGPALWKGFPCSFILRHLRQSADHEPKQKSQAGECLGFGTASTQSTPNRRPSRSAVAEPPRTGIRGPAGDQVEQSQEDHHQPGPGEPNRLRRELAVKRHRHERVDPALADEQPGARPPQGSQATRDPPAKRVLCSVRKPALPVRRAGPLRARSRVAGLPPSVRRGSPSPGRIPPTRSNWRSWPRRPARLPLS